MKDRFFYPLAILVIAGIIAFAMLPGRGNSGPDKGRILTDGYLLSGEDLKKLTAAPGTIINFVEGETADPLIVILSTNIPRDMIPPSAGVFGVLASDYELAFAGKALEITVNARAGTQNPLEQFDAAYFTSGAGDSGWRNFTLSSEYQDYSFTFSPKHQNGAPGRDYVGVWPGAEGKNLTMEIKSITIKIIN